MNIPYSIIETLSDNPERQVYRTLDKRLNTKVDARRNINCNTEKCGENTEVLVTSY